MASQTMTDVMSGAGVSAAQSSTESNSKPDRPPITVTKPTPYTFDLTHLLACDLNPLPPPAQITPSLLNSTARDGAQVLVNQLLITCAIRPTPEGLEFSIPRTTIPINPLPRRQVLPTPKAPTKWEAFARKKGIGKFGGSHKGGAILAERKKNMVYDEERGEWVKKWGYKGKNKAGEGSSDWLVELDDKQVAKEKGLLGGDSGKGIRGEGKRERMERVRRQDRRERNNQRRGKKGGGKTG